MKRFTLLLLTLLTVQAWATADLTSEMDALGANKDLMRQAKAIDPKNRIRVVQNRAVDRTMRLELGLSYGANAGGDSYVYTNNLGGQMDFHFTPHWSLGARYYDASNTLTSEGKQVYQDADNRRRAGDTNRFPAVDYIEDMWLVVGAWYPIYGKISWFEKSVSQFDIYMLAGGGQVNLASGTTPTYTAGGGVGFWWTQHFSTRLEARWQGYRDHTYTGESNVNLTVLSATVGFLL